MASPNIIVRDHDVLRFETASNDVKGDYGINKAVENLVPLRENCRVSPSAIRMCSRISWKLFWIEESSESWLNQLYGPMASGFPDSNWTTPGNWP